MTSTAARVLVVDDDPFMCEALAMALGTEGYQVRTETNGTFVQNSITEFRPSVALVDLKLPEGPDGFAIT